MDFIKKAMDWVLEKEADAAKNCHASPKEIEQQIKLLEEKREKLRAKFQDEDAEFGHVLDKLHFIKAQSLQCYAEKR